MVQPVVPALEPVVNLAQLGRGRTIQRRTCAQVDEHSLNDSSYVPLSFHVQFNICEGNSIYNKVQLVLSKDCSIDFSRLFINKTIMCIYKSTIFVTVIANNLYIRNKDTNTYLYTL